MARLHARIAAALAGRERPRVALFRSGGLGDTLLVVPAVELLLREHPGARLTLVGSVWAERLLPLLRAKVRVVRFDSPALTPLFGPDAPGDAAGLLAASDAVVIYCARPGGELGDNARRFCRGPVVEWPVEPPPGEHASLHLARALVTVAAEELPAPALTVPQEALRRARGWLKGRGWAPPPLAVHPGSGSERKCWPADRFARLLEQLGTPCLMLEGPADRRPCRLLEERLAGRVPLMSASGLGLSAAAALLSLCRCYVGNDSGVSHLAAALGVPTVAVFGPTDPRTWAPRGPVVKVVCPPGPGRGWPGVGRVRRAVLSLMGRGRRGGCGG